MTMTQSILSKQWADYSDDDDDDGELPQLPVSWEKKPDINVVSLREIIMNDSYNDISISDVSSDTTTSSRLSEYSVSSIESTSYQSGSRTFTVKLKTVQIAPELVSSVIGRGGCNIKKLVSSEAENRCFVRHISDGLFEIRANNSQCVERVVPKLLKLAGISSIEPTKNSRYTKKEPTKKTRYTKEPNMNNYQNKTIYSLLDN